MSSSILANKWVSVFAMCLTRAAFAGFGGLVGGCVQDRSGFDFDGGSQGDAALSPVGDPVFPDADP